MIESFEVENFECFDSLKLSELKRVNIITGENASGKTALLEALFAAARGNPEGLIILNQLRGLIIGAGIPGFPAIINAAQFPALWNHWFYSSRKNGGSPSITTKISFQFIDSDKKNYSGDFTYAPDQTQTTPQNPVLLRTGTVPFVTARKVTEPQKPPISTSGSMTLNPQGQLQGTRILPNLGPSTYIFTAGLNYAEGDTVTWFSQLRESGGTNEIVEFLKNNFPFIQNLEVLQPTPGASAGIFATLTSGSVRRLQLLSSGIYKIITILLACAKSRKGIVLIDEIENGIFYDKYTLTWDILNRFSKDYNCQLFITSHSAECLRRLVPIIGDDVGDFSLLRTERENGKCVVRHISGASMKAALKRGGEIRGGTVGAADENC
ncbi:MAG: AAA family ATPase [Xanthobacteraceae bacterium]